MILFISMGCLIKTLVQNIVFVNIQKKVSTILQTYLHD